MGRAPCCDKANVKRGPWSPEEDAKLKSYIEEFGTGGNWIALPQKIGLKRCGKSCRLRWLNYLRPNIKHGGFTEEEDAIICSLYMSIGSRWSIIAGQLPGRTDNDIKNYWNTKLKKKLLGKQRKDPRPRSSSSSGLPKRKQNLVTSEDISLYNTIPHPQMSLPAVHAPKLEQQVYFQDQPSFTNLGYVEGKFSADGHHQDQSFGSCSTSNNIPHNYGTSLNPYDVTPYTYGMTNQENMSSVTSFNSNYSYPEFDYETISDLGVPYFPGEFENEMSYSLNNLDMVNYRSTITSSSTSPASSTTWQGGDMTNTVTYSPSVGYNYQIYPESTVTQGFLFQESGHLSMQQQTVLQQ